MAKSGAILREVGTTNRTRLSDYEQAINERTRLLLRVHRSNFEITGFTEQPSITDLVALAEKHKLPLMEDLGSGALFDLRSIGINDEPGVLESLRSGVPIVTGSINLHTLVWKRLCLHTSNVITTLFLCCV